MNHRIKTINREEFLKNEGAFYYSPFSSQTWVDNYWSFFKKDNEEPFLLSVDSEEGAIIFPFKKNKTGAEFICSHKTDYNYPIIFKKETRQMYEFFFKYIKNKRIILDLKNIPGDTLFFEFLKEKTDYCERLACPFLNSSNFKFNGEDKYFKAIEKNVNFSNFNHRIIDDYNLFILNLFYKFNKEWWNEKGYPGIIENEQQFTFFNKTLSKMFIENMAFFSVLELEKKICSILIFFKKDKKVYYYAGAHDINFKKNGVGKAHLYILLKKILKENKFNTVDFMRGNESYKKYWCNEYKYNYNFFIR